MGYQSCRKEFGPDIIPNLKKYFWGNAATGPEGFQLTAIAIEFCGHSI
jgi:hypothetical protein